MKTLSKIILSLFFVGFLTSCVSSQELDINEFTKKYNEYFQANLLAEDFIVTNENDRYVYSYLYSKSCIIRLYADSNGVIIQSSITTTDKKSYNIFNDLCLNVNCIFTNTDKKQLASSIKESSQIGTSTINKYKLITMTSEVSKTLIVNHINDEINTNSNQTLKNYINDDDIKRPTINKNETTSRTIY